MPVPQLIGSNCEQHWTVAGCRSSSRCPDMGPASLTAADTQNHQVHAGTVAIWPRIWFKHLTQGANSQNTCIMHRTCSLSIYICKPHLVVTCCKNINRWEPLPLNIAVTVPARWFYRNVGVINETTYTRETVLLLSFISDSCTLRNSRQPDVDWLQMDSYSTASLNHELLCTTSGSIKQIADFSVDILVCQDPDWHQHLLFHWHPLELVIAL